MAANEHFEKSFNAVKFDASNGRNAIFEACSFNQCDFTGLNCIDLVFEECEFIDCDFSGAHLNQTAFRQVSFQRSKLIGLNFEALNTFGLALSFNKCILDYSSFFGLKIAQTVFSESSLKECDFTGADLRKATFNNSNLSGAIFDRTNLQKADFSDSHGYVLNPANNQVKGAIFSKEGLLGLLKDFKIEVK